MSNKLLTAAALTGSLLVGGGCEKPSSNDQPGTIVTEAGTALTAQDHSWLVELGNAPNAHFLDENGDEVTLTQPPGDYTISFLFAACGDTCPLTANALKTLSDHDPNLKHFIFSVDPYNDFVNGALVKTLSARGLRVSGPNKNTYVFFLNPTPEKVPDGFLDADPAALQHLLNLITNGKYPKGHSGAVGFVRRGQLERIVTQGPNAIVDELLPLLSTSQAQGR